MRILLEGDCLGSYLAKCHEAVRTGLKRTFTVELFGEGYEGFDPTLGSFAEVLQSRYGESQPDLLFVFFEIQAQYQRRFRFNDLASIEIPKAIFVGDYWNITEHYKEAFVHIVQETGIELIWSYFPGMVREFADTEIASRVVFLPPCFDPAIFNDWGEEKIFDVGFLAAGTTEYSAHYPERHEIHRRLLEERDIRYLWGDHPGWGSHHGEHPFVGKNFSRAINSCGMFITTAGSRHHPNPKYCEILASRSLLLAERPDGAEELGLKDGVNYVEISPLNVVEKIHYYLSHPDERERISQAGYELAMKRHSCYVRALDFYSAFQKQLTRKQATVSTGTSAKTSSSNPQRMEKNMTQSSFDQMASLLGLPPALLHDDNRPQHISLPDPLRELFLSSAPQYTLYRMIRHLRPRSILEIGTQHGASAVAMAFAQRDNGTPVDITCIDPFLPSGDNLGLEFLHGCSTYMSQSGFLGTGIQLFITTSEKVLPFTKRQFDFIVVDGSHRYEDVKFDLQHSLPLCSLGGYLWVHDYMIYESVRRAVVETVVEYQLPFSVNEIQRNSRGDLCGWALVRNLPLHHLRANPTDSRPLTF